MVEQVPQSTIEDWLNKHSIHRSYISAISDILANPQSLQFKDRLQYLISAARILRESEGKLYMSYHIARMVAYILQAQEGTDREPFNRLAKNLSHKQHSQNSSTAYSTCRPPYKQKEQSSTSPQQENIHNTTWQNKSHNQRLKTGSTNTASTGATYQPFLTY